MLSICFGLLFLYWVLRIALCKSSILQIFLAFVSLALFLILPKQFQLIPTLVVITALGISLVRHVKQKETSFRLSTFAGWLSLYTIGAIVAILSASFRYQDNQVIGRVILTGNEKSEWITWQNPTQPKADSAWMPSYEVVIQDTKGRTLYKDFLMGDYVGVRAQIILIHWPLQILGFSHLGRLDLVHNGYSTAQRHQLFPHAASTLPFSLKLLEKIWSRLFMGTLQLPGVKSTTLESSYLPLRNSKLSPSTEQYDLVLGPTGLSAVSSAD